MAQLITYFCPMMGRAYDGVRRHHLRIRGVLFPLSKKAFTKLDGEASWSTTGDVDDIDVVTGTLGAGGIINFRVTPSVLRQIFPTCTDRLRKMIAEAEAASVASAPKVFSDGRDINQLEFKF